MSTNTAKSMPDIEVKIETLNKNKHSKVKAFATLIIGNAFVITGVKILELRKGLFVGMPSKKKVKGDVVKYHEVCYPITKEAYEEIKNAVLDAYSIYLEEQALLNEYT